jgi:phosphate transport system permease protein
MTLRNLREWLTSHLMLSATILATLLLLLIGLGLLLRTWPLLVAKPLGDLLFSGLWRPSRGEFGFRPFFMGTMWVTALAMLISVPLCTLTAIYLAEYAKRRLRAAAKPLVDLLAGIPSVVYGLWGVLVIVPLIRDHLAPLFGRQSAGYSVFAGGVVLALMVAPIMISVMEEIFRLVPQGMREAALAVGATRWEAVKHVVLRHSLPGLVAAVLLGFSRAFGETLAVMMVVGNVPISPRSFFDPGYPLTALIANNYGEMMSVPLYDSALMMAALVLFVVVLFSTLIARLILHRLGRRVA